MVGSYTPAFVGAALALVAVGCGSCGSGRGEETRSDLAAAAAGSPETGVVEGVVRLAEGAELPSYPRVEDPARPAPPESCTPPRLVDRQPVRLADGRGLENVLVAAAEFEADLPHEPQTRRIVIRDCRLSPMFVAATRGDTLELKNETDYPFMPAVPGGGIAQALLEGQSRSFPLDQGGIRTIQCTFAAECGRADVVVLYHPVHTLSGEGGSFRLEVPAGEELEVHAWHPLFQEASETLSVEAGKTRRVELTLRPAATPEPPRQAPEGEGAPGGAPDEGGEPAHPEDDSETLF